jgi:hypothetical protein
MDGLDSGLKPFRFEKLWPRHPEFMQKVKEWWGETQEVYGKKMYQFHQRLKHIKMRLKKWNQEVFGNIQEAK